MSYKALSAATRPVIDHLEDRKLFAAIDPGVVTKIAFQPSSVTVPAGFAGDFGNTYAARNGLTYGWSADARASARDRNSSLSPSQPYDAVNYLNFNGSKRTWEIAVPNGRYLVRTVAGDAAYADRIVDLRLEGTGVVKATTTSANRWVDKSQWIDVADGKLTLTSAVGSSHSPINFLEITREGTTPPSFPTVTVKSTDVTAKEGTTDTGRFTFTRTGSLAEALTVNYSLGGTATNGSDYDTLVGTITFPAGSSTAGLPVKALSDGVAESSEDVDLTLSASDIYSLGSATFGTVVIYDASPATSTKINWTKVASGPINRVEMESAEVGGKMYVFSGYTTTGVSGWQPSARVDKYDPATNKWTRLADMPIGTTHGATAVVGTKIYIAGGYTARPGTLDRQDFSTKTVHVYDTETNTWSTTTPLPSARATGGLAAVGRTLVYVGGDNASRKSVGDTWTLDLDNPSAGWKTKATFPAPRNHFGTVAVDGNVYVIAGQTGIDGTAIMTKTNYKFDLTANTWTRLADLAVERSHVSPSTIVRNGKILALGGEKVWNDELNFVSEYDPASNSWRDLTPLPAKRAAGAAILFDDKVIFHGGRDGAGKSDTWIGTFA